VSKLITREGAAGNGLPVMLEHEVWGDRVPFRFVKDDKVIVGKDDWLFLDNDSNGFLRQYVGELKLSDQQLDEWQELLETRIARLSELGARYHFLVVPENPTVYPQMLPDGIIGAEERTVQQLMRRLAASGSDARLIYPLEELVDESSRRRVCRKTDTHWTDFGAFVGYRSIVREIENEVPIHEVSEEELYFFEAKLLGDLGYKLGIGAVPEPCTGYLYSRAKGLYDNCIDSHGSLIITECDYAPPTKCMVFGDSACHGMLACLAQTFGRMVFVHSPTLDFDLIASERPDVVISEMTERFLIMVPDDSGAKPVRQLEEEKRAAERLRPRILNWDASAEMPADIRAPSIERIETARARLLARRRREDATFIGTMAYAGLSPREALHLSWEDVRDDELAVEPAWTDGECGPGEFGRRSVPLLAPLADDLEAWRAASGHPDRGYVFTGVRERDWNRWIRRDYRAAINKAGQDFLGPGTLLDGYAALLIEDGTSPSEVARLMGITRDEVARRYWYLLEEVVPNPEIAPAAERVRGVRQQIGGGSYHGVPGAATLSRLRHQFIPYRGPRSTWEDSLGVRPLSPEAVEKIRARLLARGQKEGALLVSVMAYGGLSQQEAIPLKWRQIKSGVLDISLDHVAPGSEASEVLRERYVPMIETLADDLEEWRLECGSPDVGWIFPNLRRLDWQRWKRSEYDRATRRTGRGLQRPYYLCHTFVSLLIGEGRSPDEVMQQTGLSRKELIAEFVHLFEEADGGAPVPAAARIRDARASLQRSRAQGFVRMFRHAGRSSSAVDVHPAPAAPSAAVQEDS
jgi:alginate O-acetyltransferase complex protein AlgJ